MTTWWLRAWRSMGLLLGLVLGAAGVSRAATADVTATLQGQPTVASGGLVTYTLTIANSGPDAATGLAAKVQLPRALRGVTGGTYDFNSGLLTLALPGTLLPSGNHQLVTITFEAPSSTQPLISTAVVTASSADPNPSNNDGSGAAASLVTAVTLPLSGCGVSYNGQPAVQGLYGEYFKGSTASFFLGDPEYFTNKAPNLVRTDANLDLHNHDPYTGTGTSDWGDLLATASNTMAQPEYFSVRERGFLTIKQAGNYVFSVAADDALRVWVDEAAKASPLVPSAAIPLDGYTSVYLTAGAHPLQVLYGQGPVNSFLVISYKGPDTNNAFALVPNSALCSAQITNAPAPLPLALLSFEAKAQDHGALLTWQTTQELNSLRFDVERSLDSLTFTKIGEVAAHAPTALAHNYSYPDAEASRVARLLYYRLRQVNTDGSITYSPIRQVTVTPALTLEVYPNPLPIGNHDLLHIETSAAGTEATFRIYDSSGAPIITTSAPIAVPIALDVHELPSGLYLIRMQTNAAERITQAFVRE